MTKQEFIESTIDSMAESWPSPIVSRKAVKEFTGGAASGKSIANEDSKGTGPEGRFLLCGQTVYPKESLCAWLKTRTATGWKTRTRRAA